ncbi:MAG: cytochrome P450 [Catenulispora sp.]|nr:cytochrome P450 [Catenulispora sp.]
MTLTSDPVAHDAPLPALPPLPDERCPFGPVPEYAELRAQEPVRRVQCPTGITAWLVTRYEDVREVLGDAERFSSSPGQAAHVLAHMNPDRPPAEGEFTRLDGEDYQRFRRHIGAELSAPSALRRLLPQMQSAVDECLDALSASAPPADFYTRFAIPVTTAVVGGLIGVPAEDHELFLRAAAGMFGSATTEQSIVLATRPLFGYVGELLAARRAEPADDTVSRMIARSEQSARPLSPVELTMMVAGILISGFDTTATTMTHGLMTLFANPGQLRLMREQPARIPAAVEELVRSIGGSAGLTRRATRDTEIGGQAVRAGDFVVVAVQSANYDEKVFADAHILDIGRSTTGHLGFGYGAHQCIGMQIARQELTVAFTTLLTRVPTLRLAAPIEEVPFKTGTPVIGPAELPIAWDEILPASA